MNQNNSKKRNVIPDEQDDKEQESVVPENMDHRIWRNENPKSKNG